MRICKSKKAEFSVLLAVIATLIVSVLLLVIGYQIKKNSDGVNEDESCRLSIFANDQISKAKQVSKGTIDFPVSFKCQRKTVRIKLGSVEKYGVIDDDLVKTVLAEEMKGCWTKVGAGKLDPFRASTTVDEKFCLVCSEVWFEQNLIDEAANENPPYELTGFQYWIAAHKLPGLKTTLYEYINGERPTEELLRILKESEKNDQSKIALDSKYVVVWRVEKYEQGFWERAGLIALGFVVPMYSMYVLLPSAIGSLSPEAGAVSGFVGGGGITPAGLIGASVGLGVIDVFPDATMSQQVMLVPEEVLSLPFDFGDGEEKEFCTIMVN